jgi:DNA polymerase III subunit epsilon
MQSLLFVDTETTGTPANYRAPATDIKNWPRLVEVCWLPAVKQDRTVTLGKPVRYVIRPEGFQIPAKAAAIHGITTEMALADGDLIELVLCLLGHLVDRSEVIVAHNVAFDAPILGAEYHRLHFGDNPLADKPTVCTMQLLTQWCKIPGPYGYKWPTLQELHERLFGTRFDNAHSAEADVVACAKCYQEAIRRGILA